MIMVIAILISVAATLISLVSIRSSIKNNRQLDKIIADLRG